MYDNNINENLITNVDIGKEISNFQKLNLPNNPNYDPSKPLNRTISSIRALSFINLEKKLISTKSLLVQPIEYWTTIFNFSIGYGLLWRFPYYFHLCGGAVFFIPFFIFFFCVGIPMLTMESALGQIFKTNPDEIFSKIKKKLYGLGLVSTLSSFIINVYMSVITSWCVYFFFSSFTSPLPWEYEIDDPKTKLLHNDFFSKQVININFDNITNKIVLGNINYKLLFCLAGTWVVVFLINFFSVKINSKMLYITSISSIALLFVLLLNCLSLPFGVVKGFKYFFFPNFRNIFDYKIWLYPINQCIFSLMLGFNGNILFSSKKPENEDIYRRSIYISLTSLIIGGLATFINCVYAGFISVEIGVDELSQLPFNKASLPFIVYPLALGMMRYGNLWSLLFFYMMIMVSIQSQMVYYEGFSVYISETITEKYLSFKMSSMILCIVGFLCGIPFITHGGFFLLEWADRYATMIPLFLVIFFETWTIMRHIGLNIITEIIANKTGMVLPGYVLTSNIISPLVMIILMIMAFIYHLCDLPDNLMLFILQWIMMIFPFVLIFFFVIKMKNVQLKEKQEILKEIITKTEMQKFD